MKRFSDANSITSNDDSDCFLFNLIVTIDPQPYNSNVMFLSFLNFLPSPEC